jgi:hypothetical protein
VTYTKPITLRILMVAGINTNMSMVTRLLIGLAIDYPFIQNLIIFLSKVIDVYFPIFANMTSLVLS